VSFAFSARSLWLVLAVASCSAFAQQPAAIFADQCSGCHTIGGGVAVGPDLKGVTERRQRTWLRKFIHNSAAVVAAKDPTAVALQKQFGGMEMPAFPEISAAQDEALLDYIAEQSTAAPPVQAPAQVVIDPQAIAVGRQLFMGERRLVRGGAACISCHTARGIGGLGGGRLGPDLSLSYERLGKAQGMTGWLSATPTPIMAVTFKKNALTQDEVAALTAFFSDVALGGIANDSGRYKLLALAGGCTLLGFVAIGGAWRNRLRGVRERLVRKGGEE
jgi:mono/diheme cytochrome c family protein